MLTTIIKYVIRVKNESDDDIFARNLLKNVKRKGSNEARFAIRRETRCSNRRGVLLPGAAAIRLTGWNASVNYNPRM